MKFRRLKIGLLGVPTFDFYKHGRRIFYGYIISRRSVHECNTAVVSIIRK